MRTKVEQTIGAWRCIRSAQPDDRALERRWAMVYQGAPDSEKPAVVAALCELMGWPAAHARAVLATTSSSALLQLADDLLRRIPQPDGETVFLHGDIWAGNMLWSGDSCVALIDWKDAGVGDRGVELGNLRMHMALQYGPEAPAHVLDGWQRESGRQAMNVAYWDAVAALNTPTVLHDDTEPCFDNGGHKLDWLATTRRRDAFLRAALDHLSARVPFCSCVAPR